MTFGIYIYIYIYALACASVWDVFEAVCWVPLRCRPWVAFEFWSEPGVQSGENLMLLCSAFVVLPRGGVWWSGQKIWLDLEN